MKFDDNIYKYLFWCLLFSILIPFFFIKYNKEFFGLTKGEILDYYGTIISNIIPLIVLKITIDNGNKKIIEQFNLQTCQRHIERYENDIEQIVLLISNYHWDIIDVLLEYREGDEVIELEILLKIILRCKTKIQEIDNRITRQSEKIFMCRQELENILYKDTINYIKNIIKALDLIKDNIKDMKFDFGQLTNQCMNFINKSKKEIFFKNTSSKNEYLNTLLINWGEIKVKYSESLIKINNMEPLNYIRDNYSSFISSLHKFYINR